MSERNFDVVIYGATGFTGKLVVEYMLNQYGDDNTISWAMAGRSHEKLIAVRDSLNVPEEVPLLIVDSDDKASITEMVKQTKCVLTTVGPYQLYGDDIVGECAAVAEGRLSIISAEYSLSIPNLPAFAVLFPGFKRHRQVVSG